MSCTMLIFSGFNGFGQFGTVPKHKNFSFADFTLDGLRGDGKLLIAPSWSYAAFARGKHLLLRGFITNAPNSKLEVQTDAVITQISACDRFCLVLLENGKVLKLLPRHDAVLQEIKCDETDAVQILRQKRTIFGESKPVECFKITHIACGSNITVAISNTNAVYNLPSKIYEFPKHFRVEKLLCGFEHALLLSRNGDVYSWGNGLRGQLGQDVLNTEETPALIEALAGIKITFIAAGGWHSAAISVFGDLYTWGFNANGQLGLRTFKRGPLENIKQPTVYPLPQVIELPDCACLITENRKYANLEQEADTKCVSCSPARVFAGARHTILQMECGIIYAVGWNAHGQLGLGRRECMYDSFKKMDLTVPDVNVDVICNSWCTIMSI